MAAHNKAPEEIRAHMRRVPLTIPAVAGGEVIMEVFLRRPTAAYIEARAKIDSLEGQDADYMAISLATGLTIEEVKDIDLEDYVRISDEVGDFFDKLASTKAAPDSGGPSSQTAPPS